MKSGTEVFSEDTFEPGQIGSAIEQLQALPINGREKVDILQTWSRAVGAKVSASQYNAVESSGIDNQPE